jgi:SAM-dependent methyltransferase
MASQNSNIESYFSHRIQKLQNDQRDVLGEREVKTLTTVLGLDDDQNPLSGMRVVDLGCGDQHLRLPFEKRGASYRGIDINECNLEIDTFPLEDEAYDIAVSMAVIEHLRDPGHFLREIKRILKPGGALWMDTPDIEACGAKFWNDPTHVHPYTRVSLRTLLEMHGFRDVLVTPNYRCKPKNYYGDSNFDFFRARYLMPFAGTSPMPVPRFIKGHCTGLFVLGRRP